MSTPDSGLAARARPGELWRALALLCCLPLLLVGPSLLPGARFLPLAPVALEPLASENPAAAAKAWRGADYLASDALFPMLTDARAMRGALQRGELPLWEPKAALGAPLFAQSMFGALYPPHWLAFAIAPETAFGWIALLDLVLAGLGVYLFARELGLGFGAALVGAAVFQTAGFACANLHDSMKVEAGLWLPWTLFATERLARGGALAPLGLAASVAFSFVAGFPPIAMFCSLAAVVYALARARRSSPAVPFLARASLGIALGIALAAVQWIPMLEARAESSRPERADPVHAADGVALGAAWTLVAPEIFGRADEAVFAPANAAVWWAAASGERELAANANLLEWNLFAGALALSLAAAALCARPRAAAFPAALALLALGFAQGWPGIAWLRALPGLDLGSPARAGVLAWTAWAWLAALGAEALIAGEKSARAAPIAAACFAALGLGLWLSAVDPGEWTLGLPIELARRFRVELEFVQRLLPPEEIARAAYGVRDSGVALACFAALGLCCTAGIAFRARRPRWAPAWLALFAVAAAEGAWYARAHLVPRAQAVPLLPPSASMAALREAAGDGRVLRLDESESGIGEVLDLARPNLPQAYGIADLSPYIVFTPRRSVELWSAVDPRSLWRGGISRVSSAELLDHPVLDVLRVTAVLSRRELAHPRLEPVLARDGFRVYRRTGVPPRARVVASAVESRGLAGPIEILSARLSDPARQVVLPPDAPARQLSGEVARGTVELEERGTGALLVRTRDTPRGWLVIADAWYPGWRATVDGRAAPILAVDHALRGIALEAGEHEIELVYAPASLRLGALVSASALALVLVWTLRARAAARLATPSAR